MSTTLVLSSHKALGMGAGIALATGVDYKVVSLPEATIERRYRPDLCNRGND